MGKAVRWFSFLFLFLGIWASLLFEVYPLHLKGNAQLVLQFAPFLALVAFGVYSLLRILYNLAIFPTCPQALEEMRREMKEAEVDLKKKGFTFRSSKKDQ